MVPIDGIETRDPDTLPVIPTQVGIAIGTGLSSSRRKSGSPRWHRPLVIPTQVGIAIGTVPIAVPTCVGTTEARFQVASCQPRSRLASGRLGGSIDTVSNLRRRNSAPFSST